MNIIQKDVNKNTTYSKIDFISKVQNLNDLGIELIITIMGDTDNNTSTYEQGYKNRLKPFLE